jgi:hypothetical protein
MLSFSNWNHSFPSKLSLANAGFVYAGKGDHTYTYCCRKSVSNWIPGMIPDEVHAELGNGCETASNISKYRNQTKRYDSRAVWEECESIPQQIEMSYPMKGPYDARFNSYKARRLSFQEWPAEEEVEASLLAQAGFFYEGKTDFVRCFYCNGGVMDWIKDDNPFIRHAQMYPDCLYIRAVKGEQFVTQATKYPKSVVMFSQNDDYILPELACNYCVSRQIRIILSPCGHLGGCGICSHKHKDCPICRRKIMGRFPINY